jgi:hypothetical protein
MNYYKKNNNELLMPNQAFMDKYCKFMIINSNLQSITEENHLLEARLSDKIQELEAVKAKGQDRIRMLKEQIL